MYSHLKDHIRNVPDFPKPGILFYDIATLLAHGPSWQCAVEGMTEIVSKASPDLLVAAESRGFLIAAPIAAKLGKGLVMVRKKGKLPGNTVSYNYDLEYGSDMIEIQMGIVHPGQKAVFIDDVLATGGTARASIDLAERIGINVTNAAFLIELTALNGRSKLSAPTQALLTYDS